MSKRVTIKDDVVIKDFSKGNRRFKKARFKKAKSLYRQLQKKEVHVPKAHAKDQKIIMEKLDKPVRSNAEQKLAAEELLQLQFSDVKVKSPLYLRILDHPWVRTVYNLTHALPVIGLRVYMRSMRILFQYALFAPRLKKPILIHNDYHKNNVFIEDDKPYIIDFESATRSTRWILRDIVMLAYDTSKEELNKLIVDYYLDLLQETYPQVEKKIDVKKELQVALLCRHARKLHYRKQSRNVLFPEI